MSKLLTSKHTDVLEASAISVEAAEAWGVYSIQDPLDLPGELKHSKNAQDGCPGMVFPLRRLDGTVVFQLRANTPVLKKDGSKAKYLQEFDTGSIINVPAMMAERINTADTILIVEGTKQTIAVSQYVDDTVAVIGVQGCANWSTSGTLHPDLENICRGKSRVEILFDADIAKNNKVWDAARALQDALTVQASVAEVMFLKLYYDPNSSEPTAGVRGRGASDNDDLEDDKAGIDDVLGKRDPDTRADFVSALRATATPKPGRRPADKKKAPVPASAPSHHSASTQEVVDGISSEIVLNHDDGVTQRLIHNPNGEDTTETLHPFVAEIMAEEVIEQEVNHKFTPVGMNYTLLVSARDAAGRVRSDELTIPANHLERVNDWLTQAGRITRSVPRFTKPSEQIAFANLVRANSDRTEQRRIVQRLGWVFDDSDEDAKQYRWLYPDGGIGASDTSSTVFGTPASSMFASMDIPDPQAVPAEDISAAVRRFLDTRDLMRESHVVAWDAGLGAYGLSFLPVPPMAALAYFGKKSSGKSTVAQGLAAALSSRWRPTQAPMLTFNSSPAAMDVAASGVHNCFIHVDDLKPEADARRRADTYTMLDSLLRRSFGSGGKARGGLGATGDVVMRERDDSAPLLIVTGEEIPTGGGFAESGLDRMFIVTTPDDGLMRRLPDDRGELDGGELALDAFVENTYCFPTVTAAYTQWLAGGLNAEVIDNGHDPATVLAHLARSTEERTKEAASRVAARCDAAGVTTTSRGRSTAARLVVGAEYFLDFCYGVGAVTAHEHAGRLRQIADTVTAQLMSNAMHVTAGSNVENGLQILEKLRAAIGQGRATLEKGDLRGGCLRLGQEGKATVDGVRVDVVNLIPDAVMALTGWPTGPSGVARDLRGMLVLGTKGRSLRNTSVGGQEMQVLSVRKERWGTTSDDDMPEDGDY